MEVLLTVRVAALGRLGSASVIHEHHFLDMPWYWTSKTYLNERVAASVFMRAHRYAERKRGKLDAGLYRHGHEGVGMVYITGISHRREGLAELEPMLLGEDIEPRIEHVEALIMRRLRVIEDLVEADAKGGSYRIHHGTPTRMSRAGEMEDE